MNRQYLNPPIREVVCEFRYQQDGHWDSASPGLVYSALRGEFPRRLTDESPTPSTAPVVSSPGPLPPGSQQLQFELRVGRPEAPLKFWRDSDESGYIAVGPYRLGVHHFRPYPTWQRFREIIVKGTQAYQEVLTPAKLQRIGLRYINDVDLGRESYSIEDFFEFYPFLGSNIPQTLLGYHCLVQFEFEDGRDVLIMQITAGNKSEDQNAHVILDLDYFLAQPGSVEFADSTEWLEKAHANLESVFEGCIRDSTRALFR